jgi:hypothetical protein
MRKEPLNPATGHNARNLDAFAPPGAFLERAGWRVGERLQSLKI